MDSAMQPYETRLLEEAAEMIEGLRDHTAPDEPLIGTIIIVVDLLLKAEDGSKLHTPIVLQCSDPRDWVKLALLQKAAGELEREDAEAHVEE